MERILEKTVMAEYDGATLQHFLRAGMGLTQKEISRAKFLPLGICADGVQRKVTARVTAGQRITVRTEKDGKVSAKLSASREKPEVLYEDRDLLVVNKPAGISVHPSGRGTFQADTLAGRLVAWLREKDEESVIRIVGCLDKDTSGVVLVAKNRAAAGRLERQREQGRLHKTYLALTEGVPEPERGSVEQPLQPDPEDKTRMRICTYDAESGKYAKTHYETVKKWENQKTALVKLWLETGRTHQIRVHMQSLGCPLLGDPLYGSPGSPKKPEGNGLERTALHAATLNFCQPFTGEAIHIEAPMPKDIARYMETVLK